MSQSCRGDTVIPFNGRTVLQTRRILASLRGILSTRPGFPAIAVAGACVLTGALHVPLTVYPIGRDQGVWLAAALGIARGKVFFRDFQEFNLPGTAVAYAIARGMVDGPREAVILLGAASAVATVIVLYYLVAETVEPMAGILAAVVFASVWPFTLGWWDVAQKDFLAAPWILLATWFAARNSSWRPRRRLYLVMSGICVGIAAQFKPTFAFAAVLLAIASVVEGRRPQSGGCARGGVVSTAWECAGVSISLFTGIVLAFAPLGLYLARSRALADAMWLLRFGSEYVTLHRRPMLLVLKGLLVSSLASFGPLLAVSVYGAIAPVARRQNPKHIWLWVPVVCFVLAYVVQGRGWEYHMHPSRIVLCMFAGIGIRFMWRASGLVLADRRHFLHTGVIVVGLAFIVIFSILTSFGFGRYVAAQLTWGGRISREDYLTSMFPHDADYPNPLLSEQLASWIRQTTPAEDTILVWGWECQIYVLSQRMYATQAPFHQVLTAIPSPGLALWQAKQQERFLALLRSDRPRLFIVTTADANPITQMPSDRLMARVPGLRTYIDHAYVYAGSFGRFLVFRSRSDVESGRAASTT